MLTYAYAFLFALMTLMVSGASTLHSPPRENSKFEETLTYLSLVANDYATVHEEILAFNGLESAFNLIDTNIRTVESHLKDTVASAAVIPSLNADESKKIMAGLGKPYPLFMQHLLGNITEKKTEFEKIDKVTEVYGWLEELYDQSNALPLTLEEKLVDDDAREVEEGRKWCNILFDHAMAAYRPEN